MTSVNTRPLTQRRMAYSCGSDTVRGECSTNEKAPRPTLTLRTNAEELGNTPLPSHVALGMTTVKVDVWSDIACPWCYIGQHRFRLGLEKFAAANPGVDVEIEGHSYELSPDLPTDFDGDATEYFTKKGFQPEQFEKMHQQLAALAADEGLEVDFEKVQHANTASAHRVLQLAKRQGKFEEAAQRLYRAYFVEGVHMRDVEAIAEALSEVGLDADEVRAAFDDEDLGRIVHADATRAKMLGASGVPFFLFDHKYAVPGAQSADVFADVLTQVVQLQQQTDSTADTTVNTTE